MATPVKAITYLTTLGTQAAPVLPVHPLNFRAMVDRGMRQSPPLWRPLVLGASQTQAAPVLPVQPLNFRAMVERVLTIFWRGAARPVAARRGWQIHPSGRNR